METTPTTIRTTPTHCDRIEATVGAIYHHYIRTREPMTNKELAAALGISSVGRRPESVFEADDGWVRITPTITYVEVRDRGYGELITERKVQAWTVTKSFLADIITGVANPPDPVFG